MPMAVSPPLETSLQVHTLSSITRKRGIKIVKLRNSPLGKALEVLDSIDVAFALREVVFAVKDVVVFVTVEHETIVRLTAVRINTEMFKNYP